jgi:diguanylate cyclase (GGDEF)-like protein
MGLSTTLSTVAPVGKQRLTGTYQWLMVAIGAVISIFYLCQLPFATIDLRFLLLTSLTILISSRGAVKVPRLNTYVTTSDTFIFLAILLYGGPAGILLAAADGLTSGARVVKKPRTILFNSAVMACSTFLTVKSLDLIFGMSTSVLHGSPSRVLVAVCVMALVQYFSNTGLVALGMSLKYNQPFGQMWTKNYLWSSVTYFAGAGAAYFVAYNIGTIGLFAIFIATLMIAILYFTYFKYLEDIRATAAQAEQSERERAEAERSRAETERERAEQAERHVKELNNYIREQERISGALEETKEHFRHAAFHDSLTGLPNRAMFTELLKAEVDCKHRHEHIFAVLFLDLDRFKNINDSLGHTHGDLLLVAFAHRLEKILRPTDTLARFGGDEFAILLTGISDSNDAMRVAQRVQDDLTLPFELDKNSSFTTASIGIALSTSGYEKPEDILRDADTAMYRAKENGKARYEMFDAGMHTRAVSRLRMESDLRQALEQKEFCIHYQPIIALATGRLAGFEALIRWNHPQQGLISPTEFIPVAEETGLIVAIGQWVLEEACTALYGWHQISPCHRVLSLSVNLSGRQVSQPDLVDQVKRALERSKLNPHCLKLEITESVVMENAETATAMFKELRALGVQLSIDDFGTGYSSLSYLHRFPVNYLKIDRSFVGRMTENDDNAEIVRTIVTLARNLGMEVIAEGIETAAQNEQLKALGCEYGQGYLFSRPVVSADVITILEKERERGTEIVLSETSNQEEGELASGYQM